MLKFSSVICHELSPVYMKAVNFIPRGKKTVQIKHFDLNIDYRKFLVLLKIVFEKKIF